jgi:hypothetical protein
MSNIHQAFAFISTRVIASDSVAIPYLQSGLAWSGIAALSRNELCLKANIF